MEKLSALWNLFRRGEGLADLHAATWKERQLAITILVPFLAAAARVARSFGFDPGLTDDDLAVLAGGVVVIANVVLTVVTSDKVGLLPAKGGGGDAGNTGPGGG